MLKILRSTKDESVILTLIGRIEGENLEELKRLMGSEASGHNRVLDMRDVTVVDQSAVRFLVRCEADSVTLESCPAYIRDWIAAETAETEGVSAEGEVMTMRESLVKGHGESNRILQTTRLDAEPRMVKMFKGGSSMFDKACFYKLASNIRKMVGCKQETAEYLAALCQWVEQGISTDDYELRKEVSVIRHLRDGVAL